MRNLFNIAGIILMIHIFSSCKEKPQPPVISTDAVTSITSTSAVSGGNVTDDGNATVTAKGVCWDTSDNPLVSGNKTIDGEGSGSFSSNLTQLIPNTNYFVRAYATNSEGTSYGSSVSFKTAGERAAITASGVSEIRITSANLNGTVNPGYSATNVIFEYGLTTSYGNTITASQSPVTGGTPVNINANLSGLTPQTTYHFRVSATNETGTTTGNDLTFTTYAIADADNNYYHTVLIGTQTWMVENLNTTRYNDGTPIPLLTENSVWAAATSGAYCDYNNTPANSATYGRLYNWYVTDNNLATKTASNGGKNVCPAGWHVASDAEWATLAAYLGGESVAGGKLKETGTVHWSNMNNGATNESGFTALPGGSRFNSGGFVSFGVTGNFWTTTPYSLYNSAYVRYCHASGTTLSRGWIEKRTGYSVRCVKD